MSDKVGPRELKALLGMLEAAGVKSYTTGDLSIQFHDRSPLAQADATEDGTPRDLELPDGVVDPVKMLEKINRRKAAS